MGSSKGFLHIPSKRLNPASGRPVWTGLETAPVRLNSGGFRRGGLPKMWRRCTWRILLAAQDRL